MLFVFIAILGTSVLAIAQENPLKPNIVFILADDFGYSSLNSYGADKNLVRSPPHRNRSVSCRKPLNARDPSRSRRGSERLRRYRYAP